MAYRYTPETDRVGAGDQSHGLGKWTAAVLLFVSLYLALCFLQIFQITSEGAAKRTLERATASLTEVDVLIDRQYDDLQARAEAIQPGESIELEEYPISVTLSKEEVLGMPRERIRALVLQRSADEMYRDGTAPLRDHAEAGSKAGRFSVAGFTDTGLGLLRDRNHTIAGIAAIVFAVVSGLLTLALIAACRNFGRLTAPAAALLAAALGLLGTGAALRASAISSSGSDAEYTQRQVLMIAEELAWAPIRNGLAISAVALCLLVAGVALSMLSDAQAAPRTAFRDER